MIFRCYSTSPFAAPRIDGTIVLRVALTIAVFTAAVVPAFAKPVLRGDVVATGDVLTLGDLVDGIAGPAAGKPVFRAPSLGETGTIQTRRIVDAAEGLGLSGLETEGRAQVTISRAARRVGAAEIEAAVKRSLEAQHQVDTRALSIVFEGNPALLVAPEVKAAASVDEIVFDRRTRRVSALVSVSPRPGERKASTRVAGVLVELADVAVLNRAVARGETVQASDFTIERKAKDALPQDLFTDVSALAGQVARRPLSAGAPIRQGDLSRPEIVARGDLVTIVYEVPGMVLTMRGKANEAGAQGDLIAVTNPQSKKVLQAQVVAPGKVSVSAALPGPVASAQSLRP